MAKSVKFKTGLISPAQVIIGERARKDLGDLTSLENDIELRGVLIPIIIDEDWNLIAGERRVQSCRNLLAAERVDANFKIPYIVRNDLTSEDKAIIELVENLHRKGFTWFEEVAHIVRIHKMFMESDPNWKQDQTADRVGVSRQHVNEDLPLFEACELFPELRAHPTRTAAIQAYRRLMDRAKAQHRLRNLGHAERQQLIDMTSSHAAEIIPDTDAGDPEKECETVAPIKAPPKVLYRIGSWDGVLSEIPDNMISLVEADPPYAIKYEETYCQATGTQTTFKDITREEFMKMMPELFAAIIPKLTQNAWVLCWHATEYREFIAEAMTSTGLSVQKPGIWVKPGGSANTPAMTMVQNYEMFTLGRWGKAVFQTPSLRAALLANPSSGRARIHETEKPIELYDQLVKALGIPGTICFSPFVGSGNVLISAAKNNMLPIGTDLNPTYQARFFENLKAINP